MGRIWRALTLGLKSLLLHKLRSGLTVLGIVFGVAAVISMLAIGEGASRDAQERIEQLGATNIIIRSVRPSADALGDRSALILNYGLKYQDFDRILATVPTIKRARPFRKTRKQPATPTGLVDARLAGTPHDSADSTPPVREGGRFPPAPTPEKVQTYEGPPPDPPPPLSPMQPPTG